MNSKNQPFDPRKIAIGVITYYPTWYPGKLKSIKHTDKIRGDLAIEFIKKAIALGVHIVVVDGKSSKTFQKEISYEKEIIFAKRTSQKRSPDKRRAIEIMSNISGVAAIMITEAEKVTLLDYLTELVEPILSNTVDIVVPKRDETLFKSSYPTYMYESEQEGNMLYNEALRSYGLLKSTDENFDMFFGPRVFVNKENIIQLFMRRYVLDLDYITLPREYFDTENFSNTIYFPVVLALKNMLRVQSITVRFTYPNIQKQNEEKNEQEFFFEKRKNQRLGLLVELIHFLGYLNHTESSKIKLYP